MQIISALILIEGIFDVGISSYDIFISKKIVWKYIVFQNNK